MKKIPRQYKQLVSYAEMFVNKYDNKPLPPMESAIFNLLLMMLNEFEKDEADLDLIRGFVDTLKIITSITDTPIITLN